MATVHRLLDSLVDGPVGIPPGRIVLGGFSQGGCLALSAGLGYRHAGGGGGLAGVAAVSGWCAERSVEAMAARAGGDRCGVTQHTAALHTSQHPTLNRW